MKPHQKDRKRFLRRRRSSFARRCTAAQFETDGWLQALMEQYCQRAMNQVVAMNADTLPPP